MRHIKHIALASCFILYSFVSNGQNNTIDSLKQVLQTQREDTNRVNTLNTISKELMTSNENASEYVNGAIALAEKLNFKRGLAISYRYKARITDTLEKMLNYFDLSIQIAKESKDLSLLYLDYIIKGQICRSNERYPEALHSFFEALKIAELMNDKSNVALAYQELANVYSALGNSVELQKNYNNALKLFNEIKAFKDVALCYLGIGFDYFNKADYNTALLNLKEGLSHLEKMNENNVSAFTPDEARGFILLTMGRSYEMLGTLEKNDEKAEEHYKEAEKNYLEARHLGESSSTTLLSDTYLNLGSLYLKTKKTSDAKIYLDKAFLIFQEWGSKEGLKETYLKFSIYDSTTGNYKKAYEDHKLYMQYFKQIQSDSSARRAEQLRNQYEFDKKEAVAKAEQTKKDAEARRTRNLQYTAIGAFLLIAIFLFWNNRQKQRSKTRIEKAYSELKSTQQQLIQSEKMASLGELTAGIAHEIQNPLNFVNNFSDVNKELLAEMKDEVKRGNIDEVNTIAEDVIANEEKINHHGKRADAIVKNMLQHSRSNSGKKEPTDINALADEYLRLAYHGSRAKDKFFNAEIKADFDNSIGKINIVPQDIGRVILNLINNAFYAVTEKKKTADEEYQPTVTISTTSISSPLGGRGVEIKVIDNGGGISKNIVDKIFQPFFTTKPTGQGTGLGLSLAYDIVKAHGGEIKVETKEGEGSNFTIILSS